MPRKRKSKREMIPEDVVIAQNRQIQSEEWKKKEDPHAAENYYYSTTEEKTKMLGVYLYQTIYGKTLPKTEKAFQDAIKSPETIELLNQVAKQTKCWEVAKDMMDSESLQGAVFGELLKKNAQTCKAEFIATQLDTIGQNEKENAYRKAVEDQKKAEEERQAEVQQRIEKATPSQEVYEKASTEEKVRMLKQYYLLQVERQYGKQNLEKAAESMEHEIGREVFGKLATDFQTFEFAAKSMDNVMFDLAATGTTNGVNQVSEEERRKSTDQFYEFQMCYDLEGERRKYPKKEVQKKDESKPEEIKNEEIKNEEIKTKSNIKEEQLFGDEPEVLKIDEEQEKIEKENQKENQRNGENEKKEQDELLQKIETQANKLRIDNVLKKLEDSREAQKQNTAKLMQYLDEKAGKCFTMMYHTDYFMFGLGSNEFKEMKKAVDDVADYTMFRFVPNAPYVDPMKAAVLLEKQTRAIGKIEEYLDRKYEDFNEDPFRRNDPTKQKREQPRIVAAVESKNMMMRMQQELKKVVRQCEDDLRRQLENRLKEEEAKRLNPDISPEEYRKSVAISLDMITNLSGKCWSDEDTYDAAAIYQRHLRDANKVYDQKEVDKLLDPKFSPIKSAIDLAQKQYEKENKPLTNEDLWKVAKKQYNTQKEVKPLKLFTSKQFSDHKNHLMKDLFSYQTKRKYHLEALYDQSDKNAVQREQRQKQQTQNVRRVGK